MSVSIDARSTAAGDCWAADQSLTEIYLAEYDSLSFLHPEFSQRVSWFDRTVLGSSGWRGEFFEWSRDTGVPGGAGVAAW